MKLNYKKYGESGEVLIILHGLFGMLDNWNTLAKKFALHFQVYIVDQRNHGKSEHHEEMNYKVMANDISELMHTLNIEKAIILGHSMGGKTAMQFAIDFPKKTTKLIVADIAPKAYNNGHDIIFEAFKSVNFNLVKTRKDADEQLKPILTNFGIRQFILKNLALDENRNYFWKPAYQIIEKKYNNIISNIEGNYIGKTLFIKGGNSAYIDENNFEEIKTQFTDSQLVTIENVGHWLHAENPKLFLKEVLNFLEIAILE